MIEHLRHNEIDKARWDRLLLQCPDRLWYVQSWVLDICCPEWEALIGDDGSIMPLIWCSKFGIDYLYQPYAMQQQGVFSPERDEHTDTAFLDAIPERFVYWDIHLNSLMHVRAAPTDRLSPNVNQDLSLAADATVLRSAYSQGHRRNLRKSGDDPPVIALDVTVREFIDLFTRTTGKRFRNIPKYGVELLERLVLTGIERKQCRLLGVREQGRVIAAVCFMEWEGRSILLKSANDEAGMERQAMFHLIDRYISEHAGSGILLDFAGSNTPSVARFNAGFGARSSVYLHLVRNRLPAPLRWFKR
ncbi:MAG TPA: GNAT family N-acetyltransferase [Flavobacteriales bacterium]|nr:GNAT family N-acetyltransferase [Flavobacteriales bacterium]